MFEKDMWSSADYPGCVQQSTESWCVVCTAGAVTVLLPVYSKTVDYEYAWIDVEETKGKSKYASMLDEWRVRYSLYRLNASVRTRLG